MSKEEDPGTHSVQFLMRLITDRTSTLFMERTECPVTAAQGRVLMYVKKKGGKVTQHELEKYLGVSHATIRGLVQRLEEKGYVRTGFDSRDGRVKNVYLTEEHLRFKEQVRELLEEIDSRMMSGLSEHEIRELTRMLEHIYSNIS